jgi:DNA ligase-1
MIEIENPKYSGFTLADCWIQDLESNNSRLHKEGVIKKAYAAATVGSLSAEAFLYNCYLAYNPFFVYGVRQVDETVGLTNKPNPWNKFWAICDSLRTRVLTGNAARDAIRLLSEEFDSDEWNRMCRRVILKDLRCGFSENTVNKIVGNSKWAIPIFSCQLAVDSNKKPKKMTGLKRLEYKLDGVRMLAIVKRGTVELMSRNGKPLSNFPQIEKEILDLLQQQVFLASYRDKGFVLDGEVIGESFQKLMKQAQRKKDAETTGMVYNIFDVIPLEDFERGYWNAQQRKRTAILEQLRPVLKTSKCLQLSEGIYADLNTSEGNTILQEYFEEALKLGYEGIMIKDVDAPYQTKRTDAWLKLKPTLTLDLVVTGLEEGTGKNEGRLGALVCEGEDDGRLIRVNVGSGLSDEQRQQFWEDKDSVLDMVVEVMADVVTQNQDGSYSLRFPRFVRFRAFEAGDKF